MKLDVLYSLIAHESPECVYDLINNIARFHPEMRVGIILHLNPLLAPPVTHRLRGLRGVWVNPKCWPKRWGTSDLLAAHQENFALAEGLRVETDYFIPLASNCAFHRPVTRESLAEIVRLPRADGPMPTLRDDWAWRGSWELNLELRERLEVLGAEPRRSYHEGAIIPSATFREIHQALESMRWRQLIRLELPLEEVLLPALYRRFSGHDFRQLCAVEIQRMPAGAAAIPFISGLPLPCVKPVRRVYADPVREWLRAGGKPPHPDFWVDYHHRPWVSASANAFWGGRARLLRWGERLRGGLRRKRDR